MNAQIKITELWKIVNVENYSKCFSKIPVHVSSDITRESRSRSNMNLPEVFGSNKIKTTFINDGIKAWNQTPQTVKMCNSLVSAKKAVKTFVKTLPI